MTGRGLSQSVVNGYSLAGRTIKCVRATASYEMAKLGWDRPGVVLVLDNGNLVTVQADPEGNGPGTLVVHSLVNGEPCTGQLYVAKPGTGPGGQ